MLFFIVTFLIFSCTVGLFLSLMFTVDLKGWKRAAFSILIAVIIGGILAGVVTLEDSNDTRLWNSGSCPDCGVQWEFKDMERYKASTTYFWECPSCKNLIQTTKNMREWG